MPLKGICVSNDLIDQNLVASLPSDDIERFEIPIETMFVKPFTGEHQWINICRDYPYQIGQRLKLMEERLDYFIDRLPGEHITQAEIELRDAIVAYILEEFPDYFSVEDGIVSCPLTGVSIDLDEADPLVAIGALVTEEMCLMLPLKKGDKDYAFVSGTLIQPNDWSLRSKFNRAAPPQSDVEAYAQWEADKTRSLELARLGKSVEEIHSPKVKGRRVKHYEKNFAGPVNKMMNTAKPQFFFWRRNWAPMATGQFSRHSDLPLDDNNTETAQDWHEKGHIRSEHETLVRLPKSGAMIFSIKTLLWSLQELEQHPKAMTTLIAAFDNLENEPDMKGYRVSRIESLTAYINSVRDRYPAVEPSV